MTEKLKYCPFCGGKATEFLREYNGTIRALIMCQKCGAHGTEVIATRMDYMGQAFEKAAQLWNARVSDEKTDG